MERKIHITKTDTRNEKTMLLRKTSSQRARALIISQVNSIKRSRNKLNYLKFSNTNGEKTASFFPKTLNDSDIEI